MTGYSKLPDPTYRDTVLAPLFDAVKAHYASHMSAINRAHLVMLCETGILSGGQTRKIAGALRDIDREIDIDALAFTGEHEDYFFLIEAELIKRLGDLGGMLHVARSRNDMEHTCFRMALREKAERMLGKILGLAEKLTAKALEEIDTIIVAYTHGQPAQPTTFGHYLSAVVEVLIRDAARVESALLNVDRCPMGAAAITTSGFPIDRQRVSDLLGFRDIALNSYGCIASVDHITGLYSAIKLVFLHLGRVIQDMGQWTAFEVGQLHVPDSLVQVSSIMPQKRNPVAVEHMRLLASLAVAQCDMIMTAMHNTPFADMNDSEAEVQQNGYKAFECGERALSLLSAFVPACSIDSNRVIANCDSACITVTELADTLVRDEGLNFRQAHSVASATTHSVISAGGGLRRGFRAFADAFQRETGRETKLSDDAYEEATAPETFIARRDRPGGPASSVLEHAAKSDEKKIYEIRRRQLMRVSDRRKAAASLDTAFGLLLEG
ncbi:MAG: argininosuccinate lyase [Albidovulum sp.]|nr:argininosuccinate lyase [Albidovulum sp.]MDE0531878.1 argininosuccinate lyase [Albidovulum sp.]